MTMYLYRTKYTNISYIKSYYTNIDDILDLNKKKNTYYLRITYKSEYVFNMGILVLNIVLL